MTELFTQLSSYFQTLPLLELLAMALSLAYILLAAQGSVWCWPAAFGSTALYTVIFFDVNLLMDSALNAYYLVMAVYGFWQWSNPETGNYDLPIVRWPLSLHIKLIAGLTIIASILGYAMNTHTTADFAYLDTFTTVFAIFATYLVTQKVLENWLYWLVINPVSIYLYIQKGLIPTTVLFVIYIFISIYGYSHWRKIYREELAQQ